MLSLSISTPARARCSWTDRDPAREDQAMVRRKRVDLCQATRRALWACGSGESCSGTLHCIVAAISRRVHEIFGREPW